MPLLWLAARARRVLPAMRRLIPALCAAGIALAGTAPARAAPTAKITGRVVNQSTGRPQPGVRIVLTGLRPGDEEAIRERATTDRRGRYVFEDLPTGRVYTIDGYHEGGLFAGRSFKMPANTPVAPVIDTTLRVWETTSDPAALTVTKDVIFAIHKEGAVSVIESVTFANRSELAYIGRGRAMGARTGPGGPSAGFPLPPGAARDGVSIVPVGTDIEVPEIVPTDFGFAATVALLPGESTITYRYQVQGTGGSFDLGRVALYRIEEVTLLAAEPLEVRTDRLEQSGEATIEGQRYTKWSSANPLEPGDRIQMIVVAEAGSSVAVIGGAALVGAAIVAAVALGLVRMRRASRGGETEPDTGGPVRSEVLVAIAELDLRHQAGELSDGEWERRRSALKARLGPPEPAP